MSVYDRLGYNFDTTKFNGADIITQNTINFLNVSGTYLNTWQINDLANNTVGGYYQNPHTNVINQLTIILTNFASICNTNVTTFNVSTSQANTLYGLSVSTLSSLTNFTIHTNNLSGITKSSNSSSYPDLNSALAVGRTVLNLTYKTDSVQNNTPILGNFTSLYIGSDLANDTIVLINDYQTLNNSISVVGGNNFSDISTSAMNTIIFDVSTLQTRIDTRRTNDINFYVNSLSILHDYQTLLPFSNLGATQNSLIKLIGTDKLKNNLGMVS